MDARRSQVDNALFLAESGTLQRLCPTVPFPAAVAEDLRREHRAKIVVGDGAVLCYNALKDAGVSCALAQGALRMQDAVGVCQCAEAAARTGLFTAAQDLQRRYLRLSQAERERLAKAAAHQPSITEQKKGSALLCTANTSILWITLWWPTN